MASEHSTRSFLSGDLIWGVKQSDPLALIEPHRHPLIVQTRDPLTRKKRSRHLSENPSTYLR